MHLLIILLQQLLGLLPNGEGKKAPQVELARVPRPNPRGSDPGAFLGSESPRRDWMTMVPAVEQFYAHFTPRRRPVARSAARQGRPPGEDDTSVDHQSDSA